MLLDHLEQQPHVLSAHRTVLRIAPEAVMVGGAVRDLVLETPLQDLDYAVPTGALALARQIADALAGAYYPLDEERDAGRILLPRREGAPLVIDISGFRGQDLEADLRARDFTINAIALTPRGDIYDPLGGVEDLRRRRLRLCSEQSLRDDPLRVLRAIRFLFRFHLQPDVSLDDQVRAAAPGLSRVSPERQRDELLKILSLPEPHFALLRLQAWGLTQRFFPALPPLRGLTQSPPHVFDVYEHSLAALRWAARLDRLLCQDLHPANALETEIMQALAPYQQELAAYLETDCAPARPRWLWLRFCALAHDWGKASTRSQDENGRIHFFQHEAVSAGLAARWLEHFRCAGAEIAYVRQLCLGHMRPLLLSQTQTSPSRRSLYRFYRDVGDAAAGIILLHLADYLAIYGAGLKPEQLRRQLAFATQMLQPAFTATAPPLLPAPLLDGRELMQLLNASPGPHVGAWLEALREAQAVGEVTTREEAIAFVQARFANSAVRNDRS